MDLVAEKLFSNAAHAPDFAPARVCPALRVRFGRVPTLGRGKQAINADRLLNRLYDYPQYLARRAAAFELFHVCDHSYANVVHRLPAARTGVFCHDLDTFRSVLEPEKEARPRWFREMARHILSGMQKAAVVFYSTNVVRNEIERHGLIEPARLVQARYGVAPEFNSTDMPADTEVAKLLAGMAGAPFLLHVGSCIPRKRVDVLLDVFAAVRRLHPELGLLQVGGQWSPQQSVQLSQLGIDGAVRQVPRLSQPQVAQLYRGAALVLMPSEAEGFGLPVVEALACGSIVVASDIPVFREVGGPAAVLCGLGNVEQWAGTVSGLLKDPAGAPLHAERMAWAAQFSWAEHTRTILSAYRRLAA